MIEVKQGSFWFNGIRQERVIGRSSFKLANIVTYNFTGQGFPPYTLGAAQKWIEHNQKLFGEHVVLRVFLETGGWDPNSTKMFGSAPSDQGFWNRAALRDGKREEQMHYVGRKTLEWLFQKSETMGVVFELVIDATLKHDDIPAGEIDHVIRVTGIEMGRLSAIYPRALVIPNMRNEWNAHNQSGHSLHDVNMWAVRWDRDRYWINAPKIVDPGGGNEFTYDVGPEPGKYRAGMIHPDRGDSWETFPNADQLRRLRADARGMPVGFTESMYYVEPEDVQRAQNWYGARGWTANWQKYESFINHAYETVDYFIVHDEKGVQCDPKWPRPQTRVETWAWEHFGGGTFPPPPEEPDMKVVKGKNFRYLYSEDFPHVVDVDADGNEAWRKEYRVDLGEPFVIDAVDFFFGHDRGDKFEQEVTIYGTDKKGSEHMSYFVARRVEEKTAPGGEACEVYVLPQSVEVVELKVHVVCRVTGPNEDVPSDHPSYKKWRGNFDLNIMLIGE